MQQREQTRRPVQKIARDVARARAAAARERRAEQARAAQRQRAASRKAMTGGAGAPDPQPVEPATVAGPVLSPTLSPDFLSWTTPLEPAERTGSSRRAPVLVLLTILAVVAAGVGAWAALRPSERAPAADSVSGAGNVPPGEAPGGGTYLSAGIRPDGVVRTEQSFAAGDEPIRELVLTLPAGSPGTSADLTPAVLGLRILVDGRVLAGAPASLAAGETRTVRLEDGARTVQLDFLAAGVVDRAAGSVSGRALVLVNALQVRAVTEGQGTLPASEEIVVAGQAVVVLALACAMPDDIPLRPCGVQDGDAWTVTMPPGRPASPVVAQVDLQDV